MNGFKVILWPIFWIILLTLLFLIIADRDFDFLYENLSGNNHDMHHMSSLHDASIIILTIIIACIAWVQLHGLVKTGQADFLLRIDERLGNKSIIKARTIIHHIYSESKEKNKNFTEPQHCEYIAQEINSLGNKTDKESIKKYVLLLNFIDFLETTALFAKKGYISTKDINDLMNQSLDFFYTIFEIRINERRRKYQDPTFYINFENLVQRIRCQKTHCKIFCFKCYF